MKRLALDDPRNYVNRHLPSRLSTGVCWRRPGGIGNPPLGQVKLLAMTANHADEFVEARVASFLQRWTPCCNIARP